MTDNIYAMAVIIGIVNGIKLAGAKINSFVSFLVAIGLGILFGAIGYFGLTIETGIVVALASSGLYKIAQKAGGE